ncbi:hypothetical protein, partial [Enterobacter hormaechei]
MLDVFTEESGRGGPCSPTRPFPTYKKNKALASLYPRRVPPLPGRGRKKPTPSHKFFNKKKKNPQKKKPKIY